MLPCFSFLRKNSSSPIELIIRLNLLGLMMHNKTYLEQYLAHSKHTTEYVSARFASPCYSCVSSSYFRYSLSFEVQSVENDF